MSTVIDGSLGITYPDSSNQPAASSPYTLKNRIINGSMQIDQRNAGAAITPTSGAFTVDRWAFYPSQASKFTIQQNAGSVTPPAGFTKYLGFTVASAVTIGAGDYFTLEQPIEGLNVVDLDWGKSTAKTVTLSFWVRSSLTGTFGGAIYNSAGNYSYAFNYTISSANTWEQKTVTITAPTTGTFSTDNTSSFIVTYSLGVGATYSGTAGTWAASNLRNATGSTSVVANAGATWYITGVQLEIGSTATPFERRLYGQELALCQRYYYKTKPNGGGASVVLGLGFTNSATSTSIFTQFPVPLRTIPTALEQSGTASDYLASSGGSNRSCSSVPTFADVTTQTIGITTLTVASGQTSYQPAFGRCSTDNAYLAWSAEL